MAKIHATWLIWSWVIKKQALLGILFLSFLAGFLFYFSTLDRDPPHPKPPPPPTLAKPKINTTSSENNQLKNELTSLLNQSAEKRPPLIIPEKSNPVFDEPRAKGRKEREKLPLGIVLFDQVPVLKGLNSNDILFKMKTGDFVRVFEKESNSAYLKVQPGVDLYLAETSQQFEAAGNRFPDKPGWVERSKIQILSPRQAIEFTQKATPMTLGADPNFSMVDFYDRALKNPDPVVHRVVGPRFIELLSVHEDYVSSWGQLFRDSDPMIRSITLAKLKQRGLGTSREILEDLIIRLAELTRTKALNESEVEVLTILSILNETKHPRALAAFESFQEDWKQTQTQKVYSTLKSYIGVKSGNRTF